MTNSCQHQLLIHAVTPFPNNTRVCFCKVGSVRLAAYVANLAKLFTVLSGCNTRLLVGILLFVHW